MTLSNQQLKHLRRIGHALGPVVMIGQHGLSEAVLAEMQLCLDNHELIKVKLTGEDRELRAQMIADLLNACKATLVQKIGKTILVYRAAEKQNTHLSNIVRHAHLDRD